MAQEKKENKLSKKEEIAFRLIERQWYLELIQFLQKSFEIDDKEMERYLKGTKPNFSKEDIEKLVSEIEKAFNPSSLEKEQPKETK